MIKILTLISELLILAAVFFLGNRLWWHRYIGIKKGIIFTLAGCAALIAVAVGMSMPAFPGASVAAPAFLSTLLWFTASLSFLCAAATLLLALGSRISNRCSVYLLQQKFFQKLAGTAFSLRNWSNVISKKNTNGQFWEWHGVYFLHY